MFWKHFKAVAWLRWRLSVNQWKRGGSLNAVLGVILLVMFLGAAACSFFVSLLVGILLFPKTTPEQLLLIWDGIVLVFLFLWIMGLFTELQRSEALSLEKLLHLPVSLTGTFLLNYFSSWLSLSLILFLPATAGLCLALAIIKGLRMLILFPLLISFVVMVTAITHQFRGWLQMLMLNKRRRRAIVAFVTVAFILLVQLPNLANIAVQRSRKSSGPSEYQLAVDQLQHDMSQGKIENSEYQQRKEELKREEADRKVREKNRIYRRVVSRASLVNVVLPIGWLPYGAQAAASGRLLPGVLGMLGATLIGGLSLWRSYRTSVRLYTGGFQAGGNKRARQPQPTVSTDNFLEKKFTRLPEQVTAVMLGGIRSLLRAPEGKMLLLGPILLLGFFGVMIFWRRDRQVPELARPFLGIGAISLTMMSFMQVLCNTFGFDRAGFRAGAFSLPATLHPVREESCSCSAGARRRLHRALMRAAAHGAAVHSVPGHAGSAGRGLRALLPDRQYDFRRSSFGNCWRHTQTGQGESGHGHDSHRGGAVFPRGSVAGLYRAGD